jgi:hypothetical protein
MAKTHEQGTISAIRKKKKVVADVTACSPWNDTEP